MTTEVEEMTTCPECGEELAHFGGLESIPEYEYCPKCNDKAYNEEGEVLFLLV